LNKTDQGAIEEEMGIMTGLKRSTGIMIYTNVNALNTSHLENIGEKVIRNIPGGDVSGRTRSRSPAAVPAAVRRVGTGVGTEALIITAIEDTTAGLITIRALVPIHKKPANLGRRGMQIHHPIPHVGLALKLPPDTTERRLLLQHSRLKHMNQIPSKTLSDLFLPGRTKRPSAPGGEAPTNPT
jgi:hypothetical protein